ncbi:aldehyde dehydrogenase family protein [Alloyangia pacifica]|uniref:Succinate-semialdehyde dehydrogenase / glutarate-semialdehyde dehydrogenase n=1 Tax=Alloyangia pacifica TaxID=311180 RepID=A0A1I6VGV4_9RHOB|nr:aldehyde dehydrogenase family protein [Alloyangia pacifica]SDH97372.1 succinate-semialdehyde dehydrogenase / glutarate-semialdehyde dehydrogenase [Alloyangia pacifica]SFT12919.1 succinate-semialdehyde dehydrogenase / glutarate-semialdehyde dehydrogenase [Alloyangia pacifica]
MTYMFRTTQDGPNLRGIPITDSRPADGLVAFNTIGGQTVEGETGRYLEIVSPATGQPVGHVSMAGRGDVDRAVAAAEAALAPLAKMGTYARAALCQRIADLIVGAQDRLARLLSLEQGKPLGDARDEVASAALGFRNAAEQVKWITSDVLQVSDPNKRVFSMLQPKGVLGAITPWNFPLGLPCMYYLGPALATGTPVVWVPAPTTSLIAAAFMDVIADADLPEGALNLVMGEGPVVGDAVATHRKVHSIGFTGSSATGRTIASRAPGKHLMFELGGNGPTLVLDDADVEVAAAQVGAGCFANAGQICTATERVLVHRSVHDRFVEGVLKVAASRRMGDPFDPATNMGPLNNAAALEKMEQHMSDARKLGAEVLTGGGVAEGQATNLFYQPTVVTGLGVEALLNVEESFGPVAPILTFETMEEALSLAASSNYGLSAAVFTSTTKNAFAYAEALRAGIVNINEMSCYWEPCIPAGGAAGTDSGLGRTGGMHTIREMCDLKTITFDVRR